MGFKRSFDESSERPRPKGSSIARTLGVSQFTEAAASGDVCEVERRLQCHHCRGTEREGLFGPPGIGLMSKKCTVCRGTGQNVSVEAKLDGALLFACHGGHAEVVSLLLAKGADTEARAISGDLALVRAVAGNHIQVVSLLLSAQADPNGVGRDRRTPLQIAADQRNTDIVKFLIDSRANPDHKGSPDGMPALCTAALKGCSDIVSMLVEARADLEGKAASSLNATALLAASFAGHSKVAAVLIAAGADLEARSKLGKTPLCVAAKHNHCEVAAMLLAARADLFAKTNAGASPQSLAKEAGGGVLALLEACTIGA